MYMQFYKYYSLRSKILFITIIPLVISTLCIMMLAFDKFTPTPNTITTKHYHHLSTHSYNSNNKLQENDNENISLHVKMLITLICITLFISVVLISFSISNNLVLPLLFLTKALTEISKGSSEVSIPNLDRKDEIGKIARAAEIFKANTQELIVAKQNAESANLAKSEFLANMSHELRTPMHAILGYTEIIMERYKEGKDLSKMNKYLENIYSSSTRLLKLVNNLLDLSKLEAGGMETTFEEGNIIHLIEQALNELSSLIEDKKLKINFSHILSNPILVIDHQMIVMLLINLMSNAIKFSPNNSTIHLKVTDAFIENQESVLPAISIEVLDQGMGIPQEELDQIFNKFVQSSKTKKGNGGTGLGLAICLNIVKLHQGCIWAENNSDGGAKFKVMLPRGLKNK